MFIGYWWTLSSGSDSRRLRRAFGRLVLCRHTPSSRVSRLDAYTRGLFTELVPISNVAYRVALSSAFAGALGCGLIALMVSRGSSMILEGIADFKALDTEVAEDSPCVWSPDWSPWPADGF